MNASGNPAQPNALIHETSPYLLQHAYNPVGWRPWGDEALALAREEKKPIFLSIGYSACHWCHVMEHESFENEDIAAYMNENFINIKVDREERPDLDEIYMNSVQAMTGSGGWPMSVFLTPDLKPFYGGTYFPPRDMYGRPGFMTVLQGVKRAWEDDRDQVLASADKLTAYLHEMTTHEVGRIEVSEGLLDEAYQQLESRFDAEHGGFGGAPKFPHGMDVALLLRDFRRTGRRDALRMAEFSLRKMAEGGMYDQIGGGFHRYSTDERWLVPHFEKMLYDNALLAKTYTEAYQLTGEALYRKIAKETLDYVLREMTSPEGGFYSTQDADSDGEEGKFFVWTPREIDEALSDDRLARLVKMVYGIDRNGNFEGGTSILHVNTPLNKAARESGFSEEEAIEAIKKANCKLFGAREQRVHPGRDEKILTDWNGLMISAMALAAVVFDEPRYGEAAARAADFIDERLSDESGLLHVCKQERAHTSGFLSDYSFLINGLLDLYESGRDARRLRRARDLADEMIARFSDERGGGFFYTSGQHKHLIARTKDPMDNAVPSGNSMAALGLFRLAEFTGNPQYRAAADRCLNAFAAGMKQFPSAYSQMLSALDFMMDRPREIVLAAESEEDLRAYQRAIFARFIPSRVVLYAYPAARDTLGEISELLDGKTSMNGKPAAYVCRDFTCQQPVTSVEELEALLEE
ncbi:MAG: DUF255 domain-containing protein [bacterium]|nr:DUF255 domain-containing protein [bacterium]